MEEDAPLASRAVRSCMAGACRRQARHKHDDPNQGTATRAASHGRQPGGWMGEGSTRCFWQLQKADERGGRQPQEPQRGTE